MGDVTEEHRSELSKGKGELLKEKLSKDEEPVVTGDLTEEDDEYAKSSCFKIARALAHPSRGEEIVISGLAGKFPDSHDVYHFRDNLYNKVDMVSSDARRWLPIYPDVPQRTGKLFNINKFDAGFFGIHWRQAHSLDPGCRLVMERAVECIIDAGFNPSELEKTKTGVFVGTCFTESDDIWYRARLESQYFQMTGNLRCMIANRLSYFLKLNGPSMTVDTACSSSLYALQHAYDAIRNGTCDQAIVCGINICVHPYVSLQFAKLGVLSRDGRCKVFDERADGYARSEAGCTIFLQKAKDARRIYSEVVHAKSNCDGFKPQGITYPSGETQMRLLKEFYQECEVDPSSLSFLEAHGTGTQVGDPEEISAMDTFYCRNRTTPLLIGSVKSNIGHSEPTSGLCSITKAILAYQYGLIPPNINFQKPRQCLEGLVKGRMKVVTEKTPFQDDRGLIGINNFGFGGANCHVLLKKHSKVKSNQGLPDDDLPRLVCVSGRKEVSITSILDDLKERELDAEFVKLYHEIFSKDISGHHQRGYAIISKSMGEIKRSQYFTKSLKSPLYLVFTDFGANCSQIVNQLFVLPLFAATAQRIHNILMPKGYNVTEAVLKSNNSVVDQAITNLVIQIGIVDILEALKVDVDGYFGCGLGEFVCAYIDDALTLEEAVLSAYEIASSIKTPAASYLIYSEAEKVGSLPGDVRVTEIYQDGVVVTGNPNSFHRFVKALSKRGIDTKVVKESVLDFTSLQIKLPITKPKSRSVKWASPVTSKVVDDQHFLKSLAACRNFKNLEVEHNSIIVELGVGQLFAQGVVSFEEAATTHSFVVLLDIIGKLYEHGQNPRIDRLYQKVDYPVSRGTPMISPLIKWNHDHDQFVVFYKPETIPTDGLRKAIVSLKKDNWSFVGGHVIDGRCLFPATGYLVLVWETLANSNKLSTNELPVVFENCKFLRATGISDSETELSVTIQPGNGIFEVVESGSVVVTGRIYSTQNVDSLQMRMPLPLPSEKGRAMCNKDIYKELRLRGYNYKGAFRQIKECDSSACTGLIHWDGNWISFMDNMLQMKLLQHDTRLLYIPTTINKLTINGNKHVVFAESFGKEKTLPVYIYKDADIIRCGGIEIRGVNASSIVKRKSRGKPVLEKYVFVPNNTNLPMVVSVRVNMQLILENLPANKIKAIEVVDKSAPEDYKPLAPLVHEVLGDLPLIQPEITVYTNRQMELPGITVEDKKLVAETDCHLVIGSYVIQSTLVTQQCFGALKPGAFVLSREPLNFNLDNVNLQEIEILTYHVTDAETLILFRKIVEAKPVTAIDVTQGEFVWLEPLQRAVKNDPNVIVFAQNADQSGVLGLVNCLRREPGGNNVRCVNIVGEAPQFDPTHPFYSAHLKKNLAVNVLKHGVWGTYRHLLLEDLSEIEAEHGFVNVTMRGDLSSLKWIEGPLKHDSAVLSEQVLVHVYVAALNFRDIMTATGKLNADVMSRDRLAQDCIQGIEFAGRTSSGKRIMGMMTSGALASILAADRYLIWDVPDNWTLAEAATIPVVYGTVIYAFFYKTVIQKGNTILIHAGSGGIGQAAINVALYCGCTVFTTVGTQDKRQFIRQRYPQIPESHIGNSRDVSFEQMIYTQTNGRGVDVVLNSLAEEKLQASVRCLAKGGTFLEIGKFDLANDNALQLFFFEKEASFHGIMIDRYCEEEPHMKDEFSKLLGSFVVNGAIKPLPYTCFKENEVEQAFRYMAGGKHMGKVLIELRQEETEKISIPKPKIMKVVPRYTCNRDKVYIIIGGLGGFGLELADWLVLRGARKLVLTSRSGIKTGYQSLRIKTWQSYQTGVHVSTADVATREGCEAMLREACQYGEIEAIFNLAVVLKDALFENQTLESFQQSFAPKAITTQHLDALSRVMCPSLKDFVIFSSVSCGRGNAGQTNYGMANSIMEEICEKRHAEGLPALAVEWGAIGDVGLVAEMQEEHIELEIGGTLQQNIASCLAVMDNLMKQKEAIVSSIVVAEKKSGAGGADNIIDAVVNILGLDVKTIIMQATLAESGMDSMTAVEIKQTLEREFDLPLSPQNIRSMTFARLLEIQDEMESEDSSGTKKDRTLTEMEMLVWYMTSEEQMQVRFLELNSKIKRHEVGPKILIFPGIEGVATAIESLTINTHLHHTCLQYQYEDPESTVSGMARNLIPLVESLLNKNERLSIIGYSFGALLALECISTLESRGYTPGTLLLIDGAPELFTQMLKRYLDVNDTARFETEIIAHVLSFYISSEVVLKNKERILKAKDFEKRLAIGEQILPKDAAHSKVYLRRFITALYQRINSAGSYKPVLNKIKSTVTLFKPSTASLPGIKEDYRLSELTVEPVRHVTFAGNHATILSNRQMAKNVDKVFGIEVLERDEIEREKTKEELKQNGTM